MKRKKIFILIILFANFILIIYFIFNSKKYQDLADDLLFLKSQTKGSQIQEIKKEKSSIPQYEIEINFKNLVLQSINLTDTVYHKKVKEQKIAPGVQGEFEILLKAKEDSNYQLTFKSEAEKPKNLIFNVKDQEPMGKLEDLNFFLQGDLKKNEEKKISIQWKWKYENGQENEQDTQDAKSIREYNFIIYATGQRKEKR